MKNTIAIVCNEWVGLEELEQFSVLVDRYEITIFGLNSYLSFVKDNLNIEEMKIHSFPEFAENPTFLSGLEDSLKEFDVVILKGRTGFFAYQVVKAKLKHHFDLLVWEDNARSFYSDENREMRTIRREVDLHADAYLVQSHLVEKALLREGVLKEKIYYVHPVVYRSVERKHTFAFDLLFASFGISPTDWVIYFLGPMNWDSQWMDLVEAVHCLQLDATSYGKRVKVICSSMNPSQAALQRVADLKLENSVVFVLPSLETHEALLGRCQCIFTVACNSENRIEGNPFPFLLAMKNEIPVVSGRSPLVEETVGKHRIDYCVGSPDRLMQVIKKSMEAKWLLADIAAKNKAKVFFREQALVGFINLLEKRNPSSISDAKISEKTSADMWMPNDEYVTGLYKKEVNK